MNPQLLMLLMFKIIAGLPPLLIIKCKCVCKEWYDFISSKEFLLAHTKYAADSLDQKLITTGVRPTCLSRLLNRQSPNYLASNEVTAPANIQPKNIIFLASLDGMLCVTLEHACDLLVWNPLTGAYRMLSNRVKQGFFKTNCDSVGFYVDATYDYNIIHIKRRRGTLSVYLFSLSRGSWKHVPFLKKTPYSTDGYEWSLATFSGDVVYFRVSQSEFLDGIKSVIRFDVNTHKFSVLEYPRSGTLSLNGALFSWRSELYAYDSCGYFNKPFELWKLQNGIWTMIDVYRYRVCLPFPRLTTLTHYNVNGSTIVITVWRQILEIDVNLLEVNHFDRAGFHGVIHGAVYTDTVLSPWF